MASQDQKETRKEGLAQAAREAVKRASANDAREVAKKPALYLAEYGSTGDCLHAAEKLRDAGYTKFDAHTPFPIHGMDRAMGLPDSKLGWIVLCGGLTGVTAEFA